MRQFNVGQVVTCILRDAACGDYKVVAAMPGRDGDHMYRIKSPLEEHERAVRESLLVKSEGYLPEEVPKQGFPPEINHTAAAAGSVGFRRGDR